MRLSEALRLQLLYFLVFACTASWLPVFADFLKYRGLDGLGIGTVLSVTPLMMLLVQPWYGLLADRLGYKRCLRASALLAAACYACYPLLSGFWPLLLLTLAMSLCYNALQPLLDTLALGYAQRDPKFPYGRLRLAGAAGWASTGILVGQFIDRLDLRVIFLVSAAALLAAFFVAQPLAERRGQEAAGPPDFAQARAIFGNGQLLFLLACVFLVSVGATAIWNFYSLYLKENGASASLVGFGLSFQGLCELPFFYFSAAIIGRLGLKRSLLLTVLATALRLLLYYAVRHPQMAIAIELLHGLSWSLFWVACVERVNQQVRAEWRATGQSLLYAAYFGAGQVAGNLWTGALYDGGMRVANIFLLNAGIVLAVALLLGLALRERPAEAPAA
jgi:PPP family 3-phenylpropionic acid transporter